MKIVIADDSPYMRGLLKHRLSRMKDVEVIGEAGYALQAIALIRKMKPDVVILDIGLPTGNGIDILRNIKDNEHGPIVIVFTDYSFPEYIKKCLREGADLFFHKSTQMHKMIEVLKLLAQLSTIKFPDEREAHILEDLLHIYADHSSDSISP